MRHLGAIVAILVCGVAGCSSGSDSNGSTAACDSPGITADRVNLGLIFSDSGVGSTTFASARSGVDARIGLANEEGGVHGRRIAYEWRDDANSPNQNARVAAEFIQRDSTFGLMTVTTSMDAALESLAAQNVPVVGFGLPNWASHRNMFTNMYEAAPATYGQYLRLAGARKVGIVMTGTVASTVAHVAQYRQAFESVGLTTTEPIPYASPADSPTRVAQLLAAADVDTLVGFTIPTDLAPIVRAVRAANLDITTIATFAGYDRALLPTLGRDLAGVSLPVYLRPFEENNAALDRYRAAMTEYAPETANADQQFALNGYIYADMFLRGLDLAGACPTRDGFIKALRTVTDYDADGLIEPVNLATNPGQALSCYAFVRISATSAEFEVTRPHLCADGTGA